MSGRILTRFSGDKAEGSGSTGSPTRQRAEGKELLLQGRRIAL